MFCEQMSTGPAPVIQAVTRTLPEHFTPQEEMTAYFKKAWSSRYYNLARLEALHQNVQVAMGPAFCSELVLLQW